MICGYPHPRTVWLGIRYTKPHLHQLGGVWSLVIYSLLGGGGERCCVFPMQALITEQLELLHGTAGGGGRTIPKVMMDVLKSQACRNAHMFGDPLTADQCTALLKALSETDLPFQCECAVPVTAAQRHGLTRTV